MSALTMARKGFAQVFDLSKLEVTVYEVDSERDSEDNNVLTITSTNSTYAKPDRGMEQDVKDEQVGQIPDADYALYFPYTYTTGLKVGGYLLYDSKQYRMETVAPHKMPPSDALVFTKVTIKESNATLVSP